MGFFIWSTSSEFGYNPRMRKLIATVLLAMLMSGCTAFPEKKKTTWLTTTKSERLNDLFWEAVAAKRWDGVAAHVAPLAVFKDGEQQTTGVHEIVESLKKLEIDSVQVGDVQSEPAGADLVTTYTLTVSGKPPVHALTVWQPVGKSWVIVAHSSSLTPK
jgi:hypothetical protein